MSNEYINDFTVQKQFFHFPGCPEDWIAGPSSCYFLSASTLTQRKFAVNKCRAMGGYLAAIETEAENHFLSGMMANIPGGMRMAYFN